MSYARERCAGGVPGMLLLGLLVAGCDAGENLTIPDSSARHENAVVDAHFDIGQRFAQALAVAMYQPSVRAQVHRSMQGSRLVEHKLSLQAFLATSGARQVREAVSAAAGVDAATVDEWLRSMPEMDFYVPVGVQRRSWPGTADYVVGLNADPDDPTLVGYAPDGSVVRLDAREGIPSRVVLLIHPAEPRAVRRAASRAGRKSIEDPDSPSEMVLMADCESDPTQIEVCPGEGGSSGSSGPPYTGTTLYGFKNHLPDGWGGIELMVKHYDSPAGTRLDEQIMSEGGICFLSCSTGWSYPARRIAMGGLGTFIRVWERDSGTPEWGGDDFWGEQGFTGHGDANMHRFYASCQVAGPDSTAECATWDPNWMFHSTPSVDIVYAHQTSGVYDIY